MPNKNISLETGFEFLKQLSRNNNRVWFSEHKKEYDAIAKENKKFVEEIFSEMEFHDSLGQIHILRINRDIRFSKDKTPYKTNFGAGLSRKKPMLRGGYYIHLEPDNTFVGGGFWGPNNEDLLRIRKEFEINDSQIKKITSDKTFIKYFGELKGEDGVKTAPKGFDKNHPAIDLIKKKQYVVMRKFSDKEVFQTVSRKRSLLLFWQCALFSII